MKKIKVPHDNKSRIICVNCPGKLVFWYQPAGERMRYRLLVHPFSGSIFAYFRDYGRKMNGPGFGLTIAELYRFHKHESVRLNRLMERLPGAVDSAVLRAARLSGSDDLILCESAA